MSTVIERFAKGVLALYVAWIDEDGVDRIIVGGILISLIMIQMIVLDRVLTAGEWSGLFIDLGVFGEISVFSIMLWLVLWYILRPAIVIQRARDESMQQVDEFLKELAA